jgi:TPR repeat protein
VLVAAGLFHAAAADDFQAKRAQAEALLSEGKTNEYAIAIERLSRAGDARSQAYYGYYHQRAGNYAEAEKWLQMAAQTGDSYGQYRLGALYFLMSPPRPDQAQRWLQLAAAQGNERAKFLLRTLASPQASPRIEDGRMVTIDAADAAYSTIKNLLLSTEGVLACYRIAPVQVESIFGPVAQRCKDLSVQEYGRTIPLAGYYEFSRDYGGCVRGAVLTKIGITLPQVLECMKRIP